MSFMAFIREYIITQQWSWSHLPYHQLCQSWVDPHQLWPGDWPECMSCRGNKKENLPFIVLYNYWSGIPRDKNIVEPTIWKFQFKNPSSIKITHTHDSSVNPNTRQLINQMEKCQIDINRFRLPFWNWIIRQRKERIEDKNYCRWKMSLIRI